MGDAGSTYLGSVYAGIILQAPNYIDLIGLLLILLPLIADPLTCLLKGLFANNLFLRHILYIYIKDYINLE